MPNCVYASVSVSAKGAFLNDLNSREESPRIHSAHPKSEVAEPVERPDLNFDGKEDSRLGTRPCRTCRSSNQSNHSQGDCLRFLSTGPMASWTLTDSSANTRSIRLSHSHKNSPWKKALAKSWYG